MSDRKFYDSMWFLLIVAVTAAFCGWMFGLMSGQISGWERGRMFDRCLEWKKDFDWCRKEFMP